MQMIIHTMAIEYVNTCVLPTSFYSSGKAFQIKLEPDCGNVAPFRNKYEFRHWHLDNGA